jgi:hypothetical protein
MQPDNREGGSTKVRYKDQSSGKGKWMAPNQEIMEGAAALGRATRLQHGSGLDVIKEMPDYIANSRKISKTMVR